MKTFLKAILLTTVFGIGANYAMAMQISNPWYEQGHKAKIGRSSAAEEARRNAERAATAYREEAAQEAAILRNWWLEDFHKGKYGRSSAAEEARLRAESASTAFRGETRVEGGVPAHTWLDDFWRNKFGRPAPQREGR